MRTSLQTLRSGMGAALLLVLASVDGASAQPAGDTPPSAADRAAMYQALKKARGIAGWDLYNHYAHRCIMDQTYRGTLSRGVQANGTIEPQQIFDNLYFIGQNAVSSYAVTTSAGIVVFDALNSVDEAKTYIVGGLQKLGLDPREIKYVVVTHSHGDHYGGAQYLKDVYGAKIVASVEDWRVMDAAGGKAPPGMPAGWIPPRHDASDLAVRENETLKVGATTFNFYVTPGHTPGTLSTIFRATDQGRPHVVAFYGGLGTPRSREDKLIHIVQLGRFQAIARAARVDTLLANHQTQDQAIPKLEELRLRQRGDPNPYVLGTDRFVRYLKLQQACTEFALAQQGQR